MELSLQGYYIALQTIFLRFIDKGRMRINVSYIVWLIAWFYHVFPRRKCTTPTELTSSLHA